MKEIIVSVISGFFSLAVIWYQNYLNRKSTFEVVNRTSTTEAYTVKNEEPLEPMRSNTSTLRIFFTILIALLPWLIWKFLIFRLRSVVYDHMSTYASVMVLYFSVWLVVTIIAMLSGWKMKTFFEKLILTGSSAFLVYGSIWMIVVHHLL